MPKSDQGADHQRYQVIPRTLMFVFKGSSVLLLKGAASKKIWAGRYNGLGGHVEAGEDMLSAAKRELAEEAGIGDIPLYLCGTVVCDVEPDLGILLFVYKGSAADDLTVLPSHEGTLEWVDPAAIAGLPVVDDLPALLGRVAVWQPGSPVFSAANRYDETGSLTTHFYEN